MRRLLSLLLIPIMACLVSFDRVDIPPEGRMRLTAISDKILLVEITKVTLTDEKMVDGIEDRDIKVEGKILEVIRGKETSKEFRASWRIFHVADGQAALAKHGEQAMDMLSGGSMKTGIEDCKEGRRYVVIYLAIEPHLVLFSEVPTDQDGWRKEIRTREDPFKPTKVTEKTKK